MRRIKAAADKAAAKEQAAAEKVRAEKAAVEKAKAEKAAAEKAAAEETAAEEVAKKPEQRDVEAIATAVPMADKVAELQVRRDKEARPGEAKEGASSKVLAFGAVGEGYTRVSPATPESVITLLREATKAKAQACGGEHQLLSLSDMHFDMRTALEASLAELQEDFTVPDVGEELRLQLLGFWELLATSNDQRAKMGMTGVGKPAYKRVLCHYTCYTELVSDGESPSLQMVEVCACGRAHTLFHCIAVRLVSLSSTFTAHSLRVSACVPARHVLFARATGSGGRKSSQVVHSCAKG